MFLFLLRTSLSRPLVVSKSKAAALVLRPPDKTSLCSTYPAGPWHSWFYTCLAQNSFFSEMLPRSADTKLTNVEHVSLPIGQEPKGLRRPCGDLGRLGSVCRSHSFLGLAVPISSTPEPGLFLLDFSSTSDRKENPVLQVTLKSIHLLVSFIKSTGSRVQRSRA